ncbi:amino acid ABC transporter permease [Mechercharimyces sp. CAU 1602]|uniref:amino acid ABC transporter permease n=1 Tax=Mechercharimyces sp. CAU 1602 TaxID=2973933 RepID=UPI002162A5CF|nr:amino acid ABC transporter permease [Mechercharimyces sp. CAU 1602]MCS1352466.1 amino acid ABC transporter permease [Mechercharimyces sp. CAU 1602]
MGEIAVKTVGQFSEAALITVEITFFSLLFATILGLGAAFLKLSTFKPLNWIANVYITIVRGTPLIVQVFIFYFGLVSFGITLEPFWAGVFALALHNGAYIAEIFRGSIQSIDRGQMEAARSLGMSYPKAMQRIVLPQAFKRSIPPIANQFIIGLKDSSLVAYIGVQELWGQGLSEAASNFMQFQTYAVNGLYYLALVLIFTLLVNRLEKRLDVDAKGSHT